MSKKKILPKVFEVNERVVVENTQAFGLKAKDYHLLLVSKKGDILVAASKDASGYENMLAAFQEKFPGEKEANYKIIPGPAALEQAAQALQKGKGRK